MTMTPGISGLPNISDLSLPLDTGNHLYSSLSMRVDLQFTGASTPIRLAHSVFTRYQSLTEDLHRWPIHSSNHRRRQHFRGQSGLAPGHR